MFGLHCIACNLIYLRNIMQSVTVSALGASWPEMCSFQDDSG
jgi:hypothetical protein